MSKRILSYLTMLLAGIVLASVFQPLSAVQTFATQGNCQTFKETGKTACGRFLEYWQKNGGLPQQGFPISNEFSEKSELNGQTYTVQYFERAVFEKHPENQAPYDVLLSQLGTFQGRSKYPNGFPDGAVAPPLPSGILSPGEAVELKPGVSVVLYALEFTSLSNTRPWYKWRGVLRNNSGSVFKLQLAESGIGFKDGNGKAYGGSSTSYSEDVAAGATKDIILQSDFIDEASADPSAKYGEVSIFNISGAGPFTWRAMLPVPEPAKVYQIGQQVEIKTGVSITLLALEFTSLSNTRPWYKWRGVLRNNSGSVFKLQLAESGIGFKDGNGKAYGGSSTRYSEDVAAGATKDIILQSDFIDEASADPSAKYGEVSIYNLSGAGPFTWRKNLP